MAKKSAVERLKEVVTGKKTPAKASAPPPAASESVDQAAQPVDSAAAPAAKAQPAAKRDNVKGFTSGIKAKGSKAAQAADDSLLGSLTARLVAKGLTVKAEKASHTNITVLKESADHTAQFSVQCGDALSARDAEEIERRATAELLGG